MSQAVGHIGKGVAAPVRRRRLVSAGALLVLLLGITACGGGGGGLSPTPISGSPAATAPPPSASDRGGLWTGAIVWPAANGLPAGSMGVRALVAETGEFRLVLDPDPDLYFGPRSEQAFGTVDVNIREIKTNREAIWATGLGNGNVAGEHWGGLDVFGEFRTGGFIDGWFQATWTTFEERSGTLKLGKGSSLYQRPSSLQALQGTYVVDGELIAIDGTGVVFYQSATTGCTGNGRAELIDTRFNMYRLAIDVDGCKGADAVRNGRRFSGLAYVGNNNDAGGGSLNFTIEMALSASILDRAANRHLIWNLRAQEQ